MMKIKEMTPRDLTTFVKYLKGIRQPEGPDGSMPIMCQVHKQGSKGRMYEGIMSDSMQRTFEQSA